MRLCALFTAAALFVSGAKPYYVYENNTRPPALCEQEHTLTGIYDRELSFDINAVGRKGTQTGLPTGDICIKYITQDSRFPSKFITYCRLNGKIPLIILRPTSYNTDSLDGFTSQLTLCGTPVLLEVDASNSEKYKHFYRTLADKIHAKSPDTAMVWGINGENVNDISVLYPGDNYVDWVALNIFEGADNNGIDYKIYPLQLILSYFEKSKPVMLNFSVASYTDDGHRYFASEAADEIRRLYSAAADNAAIKAVNYISKASSHGSALLKNSNTVLSAVSEGMSQAHSDSRNLLKPIIAYKYNCSFYCDTGIISTDKAYCIINGKRIHKIKNAAKYIFVEIL